MRHGFPVRYYKKIRERNDALDCFVYNLAALEILNPNFERLAKNLTKKKKPVEEQRPIAQEREAEATKTTGRRVCGCVAVIIQSASTSVHQFHPRMCR
jgi:phage terminase large subunit GpA-like protein